MTGTKNLLMVALGATVVTMGTAETVKAASLSNSIDVLWYGQNPFYDRAISWLADEAAYPWNDGTWASNHDPLGDGSLDWNLTIWHRDDPTPNFADYDVFVVGSYYAHGLDYSGILENKEAIEAARGDRTFLSGQDADAHYMGFGGGGTQLRWRANGPLGFMVNAVNWAASGTGMGIVSMPEGSIQVGDDGKAYYGSTWWLHEDSFLKDELEGYVSYQGEDYVVIPTETSDFPVNEGLTTGGLSNWKTSAHLIFDKNIPDYLSINDAGHFPGYAVTIVTETEADGCTNNCTPDVKSVPESSSVLGLLLLGVGGFGSVVKRKGQPQAFSATVQAD